MVPERMKCLQINDKAPNTQIQWKTNPGIGDGIAITGSGWAQGGNYDYITIPR